MTILNTSDIIGHTFLMTPQEYGQTFGAHIVKMIYYHEIKLAKDPGHAQLICCVNDDQYKNIIPYNKTMNHIEIQ